MQLSITSWAFFRAKMLMSVATTSEKFLDRVFAIIPDPVPMSSADLPCLFSRKSARKNESSAGT
jgi:hypothetical protein